jgi:succinate dehydrogenase/fumarate reductase cytochrome b subunit
MITLRVFHRTTAVIVTIFVTVHVANHVAALASVAAHLHFMEQARMVYRQPVVEAGLLLCVAMQAVSGLWLVQSGRKTRSGLIASLQAASGSYLALFLIIHIAAILFGRAVFGLDTNFHFAAAGLHVRPFQYLFAPYYFLAVLALFTHLGCAISWYVSQTLCARAFFLALALCVGTVISTLVLAALMGKIYPYEVPQKYKNTYRLEAAYSRLDGGSYKVCHQY